METRRLLIAALLSVIVLVAWQVIFPPEPPEIRSPEPVPTASPVERDLAPAEAEPAAPSYLPPVEAERESVLEDQPADFESVAAASEERLVVENERYRAEFTNRGAQLVSFQLFDHQSSGGGAVDLVRNRSDYLYPFAITDREGGRTGLSEALYVAEQGTSQGAETIDFHYSGPDGRAEKSFRLDDEGLIEVEIEVSGQQDWALLLGPGVRNPSVEEMEDRFEIRSGIYRIGDEVERVGAQGADSRTVVGSGGLLWAGLEDRYFLVALAPRQGVREIELAPVIVTPGGLDGGGGSFEPLPPEEARSEEQEEATRELQLLARAEGGRLEVASYWGAKEFHRLAALPFGLEKSVNLGFFWFLARPLLVGVRWIHENVVQNYGWAIILMTVLIRIILFPLTHKSTVSMQKMQQLNPKVQAVRQKYRGKLKDKKGRPNPEMQRKMNDEVMAIYRAEGVNPAGGCLPMVMQIPVLFAFYRLLSTAVELRGAPWILWIKDLSVPDPFYVLPIVMGASQLVQQKMTPTSGDPMQRRLFMLMPIFFTILFLGFPSGLVLYWLTNNLLGIAQQAAYGKLRARAAGAGGEEGGK